jgi:hypothetical protein
VKILSRFLCLAFTLLTLQAWAANVAYKCTTADGDISFLDKRPTDGCATIEVVNIGDGGPATDVTSSEGTDEQAMQDKKEIAERVKKAQEDCARRKTELETLRIRTQIVIMDPVTQEKKTLSPEEQQNKIRQYEEYLKIYCSSAPSSDANNAN